MAPAEQGVAYGVSVPSGRPGFVYIWMDNQTDQSKTYAFGCASLFVDRLDLYDSAGRRIPSKLEKWRLKSCATPESKIVECSSTVLGVVRAHTMEVVDSGELAEDYTLSFGPYFIVPTSREIGDCDLLAKLQRSKPLSELAHAIRFTVP